MSSCFEHNTTYFWQEGKANLHDCLKVSFEAAKRHDITKLVIFTGAGLGVKEAYSDFIQQEENSHMKLVAVTFPLGHPNAHLFLANDLAWLEEHAVPLVRAHLPFDPIRTQYAGQGILGQDFCLLGNVLSVFGGSMSLAIQAVLMACDAGFVKKGEHVIALTSDTSILVRSAPTSHLLTDLVVREIFCKPVFLDISKKEKRPDPEPSKVIEGAHLEEAVIDTE